jgi:histidinol dehydrogenase
MNAIPAQLAGVSRLVMVVPSPRGELNPLVLAAARLVGINEIYRVGGAQAIAALAFGTEIIAAVDKIVGPGNAYVAAAKRRVFGLVGIDLIAGPSEILVVADSNNNPSWIAADLLSQAEHDVEAQAVLITDSVGFSDLVAGEIGTLLNNGDTSKAVRESWDKHGVIICVRSFEDAPALINRLSPEHLCLAVSDSETLLNQVRHAGAIFIGRYTPEVIGDYVAGPNHVLPTARGARFASGLSVLDFVKRTSIISCDKTSFMKIAPTAKVLAEAEGLPFHALSAAIRLKSDSS